MAPTRWTRAPRAPLALLVLALLARAASAQPRIAGRFASVREACASVGEISTVCKYLPSSVLDELSNSTKPFTLFLGTDAMSDFLVQALGADMTDAIFSNQRIITKQAQGMWIPNRLLTACTLRALSLGSTPLVLATRQPRDVLFFGAVDGPEPCTFKLQEATYTGNTYLVGKGILHTLQGQPVVVGAVVSDVLAIISVQASANAWSTVAAATSGMVGRLAAVFTRPTATNVACPAPELVARLRGAYPELTVCINAAVNGCAAGWGMPATILCSDNGNFATTFLRLAPGERDYFKPLGQIEALVMKQLYIPGQRLGLADLSKANLSSLTAAAGNTVNVSCSDGSCFVGTSPSTPAAALMAEVPVGDGITLLVSSRWVWPRVT